MAEIASAGHLRLSIVTPTGAIAKTEVTEIVAPGVLGEFGVLPGHLPFLSAMGAGVLTFVEDGHTRVLAVGPGYVEVGAGDEVVVLTETALAPDAIDVEAAGRDEREATQALATLSPAEQRGEYTHASALAAWGRARREAVERQRGLSAH
ncbi:MAG TPA: ATP synthase F1 subunit epsilon [Polyangia bacterium]|jgi:F-type H+-transporting ATPase subunit epsilon